MSGKRILVVDDDVTHLVSTRGLLEAEGYIVFTHTQGFGTTNLVKQIKPDLVLLDVNMPGLSGENLASVLKANGATRDTAIVFYSSNDEDTLRAAVKRFGIDGYISKGNTSQLRTKVAQIIASASSGLTG
jgi:CheY-like chemotaxis protein